MLSPSIATHVLSKFSSVRVYRLKSDSRDLSISEKSVSFPDAVHREHASAIHSEINELSIHRSVCESRLSARAEYFRLSAPVRFSFLMSEGSLLNSISSGVRNFPAG